jgi:hypothetical protein
MSSYLSKQLKIIANQHFVHPLKSVKIGRALLETSDCGNL